MDISVILSTILESGVVIVLAGLIVGYAIKQWVPTKTLQNKFIPTINSVMGGVLGYTVPNVFADADPITKIIYGAACGLFSSIVYDKLIAAFGKEEK